MAWSDESFRPFTAKFKTTYIDEQGGTTVFTGAFYRRSDGSFARIEETEERGGVRGTVRDIVNFADRIWTSVNPFVKAVTVIARDERRFDNTLTAMAGNCRNFENGEMTRIGESRLFGVRAVEFENRLAEKLKVKTTIAPELGCYPLADALLENGEVRTETEVVSLEFGEPDASAFQVPAGYKEASPLEMEELYKDKFDGYGLLGPELAGRLEIEYQEGRMRMAGAAAK